MGCVVLLLSVFGCVSGSWLPRHLRHAPSNGSSDAQEPSTNTSDAQVGEDLTNLAMLFSEQSRQLPFDWWGSDEEPPKPVPKPKPKKVKKDDGKLVPPTEKENPKCDQACTNGDEGKRVKCMFNCAKMQRKICEKDFIGCHKACSNHVKQIPQDPQCERLCLHVKTKVCYPLGWQAPRKAVSPHHDDKPPPMVEGTPAPRIYRGNSIFCNLYPAGYEFEVLKLKTPEAKDGTKLTKLGYKQCDIVPLQTLDTVGLRVAGKMSALSKPIDKIPSVMLFGQWAFGNHQIEFNRYFAMGNGAMLCNAYPVWSSTNVGEPVVFFRGGYPDKTGKKLATLRYKECVPTALTNGDLVAAQIRGVNAGEYKVIGKPSAIVMGKAGETTGIAFEAWTDNEVGL